MADEPGQSVKWGVQRRLEFIDFRLFWESRFNRKSLADVFGISAQQASADIAQYEQRAPQNLTYDRSQKAYIRTADFEPIFIAAASDRFLLQLVAIESKWMRQEDTWFDTLPPVEVVTLGRRPTDSRHLLRVLDAIRGRQEIKIDYQSMTGSPNTPRVIAPHALAHSAGRWYVRAWSHDHNDFRDYNINRIKRVGYLRSCPVDASLDFEWAHTINLVLVPNPDLSDARQEAVAAEYGMTKRRLLIPTRLSLSFYLMSEHNLDVSPGILRAEKQQLVLLNRAEVEQARSSARLLSIEALERMNSRS